MAIPSAKRFDESARVLWALFLAVWFAFWLGSIISGCSDAQKRDVTNFFRAAGQCATEATGNALGGAVRALANSVNNAIAGNVSFTSQEWKNTGIALATTYGTDVIKCAASTMFAKSQNANAVPEGAKFSSSLPSTSPEQSPYFKAVYEQADR